MRGADLSNEPVRAAHHVLWEGLLATREPRFLASLFDRRISEGRISAALGMYVTNTVAVEQIWELWVVDVPISIVTFLPPACVEPLRRRIDADAVPHVDLLRTTPRELARTIGVRTDVHQFIHADHERGHMYGPKALYLGPAYAYRIGKTL